MFPEKYLESRLNWLQQVWTMNTLLVANVFCCVSTHRFWRGTYVIGHHWGEEGASSLGPQKYPTAPCRALRAPWLSSGSPPNSLWGHQAGSTSNLSAGSGENNRGVYDKVESGEGESRTNPGTTSLLLCVPVSILMRWSFEAHIWLPWLSSNIGKENISF